MKFSLIITDLTQMFGEKVCLAGYAQNCQCVRPMIDGGFLESWLHDGARPIIQPFAVVEFDFEKVRTPFLAPHTEDWQLIVANYRVRRFYIEPENRKGLLRRTQVDCEKDIFGADIGTGPGWYVPEGQGQHSLGTVKPQEIIEVTFAHDRQTGHPKSYMTFTDAADDRYKLSVNDLSLMRYLEHTWRHGTSRDDAAAHLTATLQKSEIYLRIGLARGDWVKAPGKCFLQITGAVSRILDGKRSGENREIPARWWHF